MTAAPHFQEALGTGQDNSWLLEDDDPPAEPMDSETAQRLIIDEPESNRAAQWPLLPQWLYRSNRAGMAAAMALSGLVGLLDLATGREFQVMPLYLLPVGLATWVVGRSGGMLVSLLGALLWLAGELEAGANYVHPLVPYWNAVGLLCILCTVSWILSNLHTAMHSLDDAVQRRTSALVAEMGRRRRAEEARLQAERLAIVGTMSAQLAHEVRNPLGSVMLNIDLLNDEITTLAQTSSRPADEGRFLLSEFRQEIQRIKQVVDGYMRVVRLPRTEMRPLNLHEFLEQKLRLLEAALAAKAVRFTKEFDPGISFIMADGDKLWQALVNLFNNARQAMPEGGRLTLGTAVTGNDVHLSVSDTGDGIAPENLPRLFTPFFTTRTEGTGLGLALVRQIITEMGGHVTCRSAPGAGTTFTIALPLTLPVSQSTTKIPAP